MAGTVSSTDGNAANKVEFTLPPGMTVETLQKLLGRVAAKAKELEPPVIFKTITYTTDQELRVYRDTFLNRKDEVVESLTIRRWYVDKKDQQRKPGKGVTFHYEDIDEIIEGLTAMKEWLEEHPEGRASKGEEDQT